MATVAIHQLQWQDVIELVWALGPLALPTALVPTLACSVGAEPKPPWPLLPLGQANLLRHFTYVRGDASFPSGRWWTVLTSAFCHLDAVHRDHNLVGLISTGCSVHRALGPAGCAVTFLGANVVAMLNSAGREVQLANWIRSNTGGWAPGWFASNAARVWDGAAPTRSLGASAGTFALLGVHFMMACEEAAWLVRRWRGGGAPRERGEVAQPPQDVFKLLWLGVNIVSTASLVLAERQSFRLGASASVVCCDATATREHAPPTSCPPARTSLDYTCVSLLRLSSLRLSSHSRV